MDDSSSIEILPRNSTSLLNLALPDIHNFSMDHNMRPNPIKCKEMLINVMLYPNFTLRSLVVGSNAIECVSTYKILGIFSGGSRPSDKEGGRGHPDPEIRVGQSQKNFFFRPLGLSLVVWSKNTGWGPPDPSPGSATGIYQYKKACKKLYCLRILRRANVC